MALRLTTWSGSHSSNDPRFRGLDSSEMRKASRHTISASDHSSNGRYVVNSDDRSQPPGKADKCPTTWSGGKIEINSRCSGLGNMPLPFHTKS